MGVIKINKTANNIRNKLEAHFLNMTAPFSFLHYLIDNVYKQKFYDKWYPLEREWLNLLSKMSLFEFQIITMRPAYHLGNYKK